MRPDSAARANCITFPALPSGRGKISMKCHTRIHRAFALLVALALGACQATHQYTTPSKIVTLAAGEAKSFQIVARSSREQALDARTARGPGTKARRGARRRYCHALVIENNTYVDLPKLGTARADAERIAGVLNRQYDYTVTLLRDATRDQNFDAFDRLRRELGEEDNLLIYYAGRGWLDPDADRGYWLPVDGAGIRARAGSPMAISRTCCGRPRRVRLCRSPTAAILAP